MNGKDNKEEQRLLELLDAVEKRCDLSQRHLARHMGVALGLANLYLKRCIRKGLIKIREAPANRYLYYLTPKGFAEKSRLTVKYLSASFGFYRKASQSCARVLMHCQEQGWRRVLLCGMSDLAEIAALRAIDLNIVVVGVYQPGSEQSTFMGRPVWSSLADTAAFDAAIITDLVEPLECNRRMVREIGQEKVFIPDLMRL
jgi:DNA-binding MarR family transcriptional regulator